MKKLMIPILCAALLLPVAACSSLPFSLPFLPSFTQGEEPEETPEPSAPEVTAFVTPAVAEPSPVYADWSMLTNYKPPEEIFTRLSEKRLEELYPSGGYGRLLPYLGENLYSTDGAWQVGSKYGLITENGMIVTDAVYSGISRLSVYGDEYGYGDLFYRYDEEIYILSLYKESPDSYWGAEEICAAVACDGSWVTGFDFSYIFRSSEPEGFVGVVDGEKNFLVWHDKNGKETIDSRDFEDIEEVDSWSLSWAVTQISDGLFPVYLKSGGYGYMDISGRLMRSEDSGEILVFDYAGAFGEGLAPAAVNSLHGFIDTSGNWVIEPEYTDAYGFSGGYALVLGDVRQYFLINKSGEEIYVFPPAGSVYPQEHNGNLYYYYVSDADYEYTWFDSELNIITIDGENAQLLYGTDVFYAETDSGVKLLRDGKTVLIPGADYIWEVGKSGMSVGWMRDGGCAAADIDGNIIFETAGDNYIAIYSDYITGKEYIFIYEYGGGGKAYDPETGKYVTGAEQPPTNGLFRCSDSVSAGYKNSDNEWIFRIMLDNSD